MRLERQAGRYSMSEKKVIVFIVEGPSDEAALGTIMKEYFSNNEIQFVVTHGDITSNDYVSMKNIVTKISAQIESVKSKYRYRQEDFIKIIHITDTDGVYVPDADIKKETVDKTQYYDDHIGTNNVASIAKRNKQKGDILRKLRKTRKVHEIAYKIYFNSCNLEHVLYGRLKYYSDEEKQMLSDDFAERYDGKLDEFIEFISDVGVAVTGTYNNTWDYIEKGRNSLNRHTNMNLLFK